MQLLTPCSDPVPPNATVVFEVEVYAVSRGPRSMEAFSIMDNDKDKSLSKDEVTTIHIPDMRVISLFIRRIWCGRLNKGGPVPYV